MYVCICTYIYVYVYMCMSMYVCECMFVNFDSVESLSMELRWKEKGVYDPVKVSSLIAPMRRLSSQDSS